MTLFSGQVYGGVGQLGAHNKVAAAAGVAAWLYGDYGGSGGARIDSANCIAAYCPIGAADLSASYGNLANPGTYDAAPGVAPTWSASTGWIFNGSSQYLKTGVVPTLNYSAICRFSAVTNSAFLFGVVTTASDFAIVPNGTDIGNVVRYRRGGSEVNKGPVMTAGVVALAAVSAYRNGAIDGTFTDNGENPSTDIWIATYSGPAGGKMAGKIQALWIYNSVLTAQQIAGLTGAINALTSAGNYYL